MSLSRTATSTATALLNTISTSANVINAGLNSANIAALDLQERTEAWATTARLERKLATLDSTEVAIHRHAQTRVARAEELTTWLNQNPHRAEAYQAALAAARESLKPAPTTTTP